MDRNNWAQAKISSILPVEVYSITESQLTLEIWSYLVFKQFENREEKYIIEFGFDMLTKCSQSKRSVPFYRKSVF